MDVLAPLLVIALLVAVVWLVAAPLRRGAVEEEALDARTAELEAAREAKYREIRDTELDFRTGKLSDEDFRAIDRQLRGEAIEILRELDRLG